MNSSKHLFSLDGKLFHILSRIADLILLNVLWLITSVPIITIGASTTALYYVVLKMVKNEESYIIRSYFHSFCGNLRQSTTLWQLLLTTGSLVSYDISICAQLDSPYAKTCQTLLAFIGLIILASAFYAFPVLARFDNTVRLILKNAVLMAAAHLPSTILLFLLYIGPLLIMLRFPVMMISGIYFYLFIGVSATAWIASLILRRVLDRYV